MAAAPPQSGLALWLDAAYSGSLMFADPAGATHSPMGGSVGRWVSRVNGLNLACTFDRLGADKAEAVWTYPVAPMLISGNTASMSPLVA